MSTNYDIGTLTQLKNGGLPHSKVHEMQSSHKDAGRFLSMLEEWQASVSWPDKILMPLSEHLFVVRKPDGKRIIKSTWGHEYCEAHENWKLHAKVSVRDTPELINEIYPDKLGCDTAWMVLREFYDPVSGYLLGVEAVPPGYPFIHDFKPDIDGFYDKWLGLPVP